MKGIKMFVNVSLKVDYFSLPKSWYSQPYAMVRGGDNTTLSFYSGVFSIGIL